MCNSIHALVVVGHEAMSYQFRLFVEVGGPRPPYGALIDYLWGVGTDVDSDGDSRTPDDGEWTELWMAKRPECSEFVSVSPESESPLVLKVASDSRDFAERAASFIARETKGRIVRGPWFDNRPGN
jgi:hypothetical protein